MMRRGEISTTRVEDIVADADADVGAVVARRSQRRSSTDKGVVGLSKERTTSQDRPNCDIRRKAASGVAPSHLTVTPKNKRTGIAPPAYRTFYRSVGFVDAVNADKLISLHYHMSHA